MRQNRAAARIFAGLLVAGAIAMGAVAPAQAKDTGWNGTVAPVDSSPSGIVVSKPFLDTGWNGT